MSIKLMSQTWELQGMTASKKLLLLAMCDWANDAGFCFPSMAKIAYRTCVSVRQCQRIMNELIEDHLIAVVGNERGGIGSRRYQINVLALRGTDFSGTGDNLSPLVPTPAPPMVPASLSGDTNVTRTITNPQVNPSLQQISSDLDWTYLPNFSSQDQVVVVKLIIAVNQALHQDLLDELAGALRAKVIKAQWPAWMRGLVCHACAGGFLPNHALAIQRERQRVAREEAEAHKRRAEEDRRRDPAVRARGLEAVKAAIAEIGFPAKRKK